MKFLFIFLWRVFFGGLVGAHDREYRWKDHKKLHVRKNWKKKRKNFEKKKIKALYSVYTYEISYKSEKEMKN